MIRPCTSQDFDTIYEIVNDAAMAYKGVIPADRWHDPYMPKDELRAAIGGGVEFWGFEMEGTLVGVMGIQPVQDVTLIRHAYVLTSHNATMQTSRMASSWGGRTSALAAGRTRS